MEIITYTGENNAEVIQKAISVLQKGGIIIYPTETTYGMGVDAQNQDAVDKLFSYKEKREGKPLSVAVYDMQMASAYVEVNKTAENIYTNLLPGPITVVSVGLHVLAQGVESETGTLGIRIPDYPLILELVKQYGKPITATGANASYKKRPYSVQDILDTISQRQKDLIDLVIDAGELPHNEPSTVVDTTQESLTVLRQGDIVLSDFESFDSHSVEETIAFAQSLMLRFKEQIGHKGIIFALQGDMGAGKTHFTKGIAKALGISEVVDSPTYALESEYDFNSNGLLNRLLHIDTWRMFSKEEFEELNIQKDIEKNHILVIEWAEKVYPQIKQYKGKAYIIWVKFGVTGENDRHIIFSDTFIS